jgi:hypothetical protein
MQERIKYNHDRQKKNVSSKRANKEYLTHLYGEGSHEYGTKDPRKQARGIHEITTSLKSTVIMSVSSNKSVRICLQC